MDEQVRRTEYADVLRLLIDSSDALYQMRLSREHV